MAFQIGELFFKPLITLYAVDCLMIIKILARSNITDIGLEGILFDFVIRLEMSAILGACLQIGPRDIVLVFGFHLCSDIAHYCGLGVNSMMNQCPH